MVAVTTERDVEEIRRVQTLGSVRLQERGTQEIILIPTPSEHPDDPLNWSPRFRYYLAGLVCAAMFFSNFLAAGPSVALVSITIDFFHTPSPTPAFYAAIAKAASLFTTTALMQGMGNLLWMPLIIKCGRRPVYLGSFMLYTATAIWAGTARSYTSELVARIFMGLAVGSGECLALLTIADIFFLHERGDNHGVSSFSNIIRHVRSITSHRCYSAALSCGVSGGIVIAGLITIDHSWRYIYYVSTALIGALTTLVFFTMPETAYDRTSVPTSSPTPFSQQRDMEIDDKSANFDEEETASKTMSVKRSYIHSLRIYRGSFTKESLLKIFIRPISFLILPPVLWATLVMATTIGFLVAITSNFAPAFALTYNFKAWQSGLCFISGIIGSLLGVFGGGHFSDFVANWFTQRNGGIREPEMRLPSILIAVVASPLGLVLYGVGIENKLHWKVPTLGLGLLSFAIVRATNVTLVHTIDAYRPVAGEILVTQLVFKAAFGFLLAFYVNPWIQGSSYARAFGTMAAISGTMLLLFIPFYVWGRSIRHLTMKMGAMKLIRWDLDREVGE